MLMVGTISWPYIHPLLAFFNFIPPNVIDYMYPSRLFGSHQNSLNKFLKSEQYSTKNSFLKVSNIPLQTDSNEESDNFGLWM